MKLEETLKTALVALRLNLSRSLLTMLGVIIGVFSVVALVSAVKGVQNYITDQFNALGSNLVLVAPGKVNFGGDPNVAFGNNKLSTTDVELVQTYVGEYLEGVSPSIRVGKTVKYKTKEYFSSIGAGYANLANIMGLQVAKGRFFNDTERRAKARLVVLGPKLATELFGSRDPIESDIKIDGLAFKVIGVYKSKGPNFDDRAFISDLAMKDALGVSKFSGLNMKVKDGYDLDFVMKQVRFAILRDLHPDEFSVVSQKDILSSVQSILGILSAVLGAIAAISLVVGGIGIMNIMLVSVNERIREIGLRKALGATSSNIATQFMIEAILLSVCGGLIGLSFGYLAVFLVRPILRAEVPWWVVVVGMSFSFVVGVVFGTYPAIKASQKDPIEALRYE